VLDSAAMTATVEAIYIGRTKGEALDPVTAVQALAGVGLDGDRYALKAGTFSKKSAEPGRQITLIEAEAFEHLAKAAGIALGTGESRRNVVTRGIALNELIGKRFRVGGAECVGVRLCDPCGHLEKLTRRGVKAGLENRGGLRADILVSGEVKVGDAIVVLESAASAA
jgi:MOSC domain-containing protein YiiM